MEEKAAKRTHAFMGHVRKCLWLCESRTSNLNATAQVCMCSHNLLKGGLAPCGAKR